MQWYEKWWMRSKRAAMKNNLFTSYDFEELLDSREQMLRKKNYSGYGNQYNSYGDMNQYNQ